MSEILDKYLEEVRFYLVVDEGGEDILREIRSHILEKAEAETGGTDDEVLSRVIAGYGSPRRVAETYMDDVQVISPAYKRHLFRITWMVFALHAALTLAAWWTGTRLMALPFFYIPDMKDLGDLSYLPMAFIFDFGLVALLLYLATQKRWDVRQPWPRLKGREIVPAAPRPPRMLWLGLMIAGFSVVMLGFLKYRTLFFVSLDWRNPESLLDPAASEFFSSVLIAIFAVEIVGYAVRFHRNTHVVMLVTNGIVMALLWAAWNAPVPVTFKLLAGWDLKPVFSGFLIIVTLGAAYDFLLSLIRVWRTASGRRVRERLEMQ